MPFSTEVTVRSSGRVFEVAEAITYTGSRGDSWTVPAGFSTDFASVPRLAVWLVPAFDVYTRAAVLHDWFCSVGIQAGAVSAVDADGVFRLVMKELGTPFVLRWFAWAGVRWGAAFNRVRRAGWWSTFPLMAVWTLCALPVVLLGGVPVALALAVYAVLERVAWVLLPRPRRAVRNAPGIGSRT